MTEYTPFQEPTTTDAAIVRRRTWEELRRVETAMQQLSALVGDLVARVTQLETDVTDLQGRVFDLEAIQQVLLDGVYGSGYTDDSFWAPGVTTPTSAARVPIEMVSVESNVNVTAGAFSITPLFSADYFVDIQLQFEPTGNNQTWNIAVFVNDVQAGNAHQFNSRDYPEILYTLALGAHLDANDEVDVRLWPAGASNTGTIREYTATLFFLGLDDGIT